MPGKEPISNNTLTASGPIDRREFVAQVTGGAATLLATAAIAGTAQTTAAETPPSDRVVVGLIGAGDFGRRQHLRKLLLPNNQVQVAAIADVDQMHRELAARDVLSATHKPVALYRDFRDLLDRSDIDAVVIATPDHWHALIAIAAMEAGKDVYCEKPMSLTLEQGRAMVAAARRYGAVFQTGSQQRSDPYYFRQAHELVRRGAIGRLKKVTAFVGPSGAGVWQAPQTPPAGLDWNFWLGPAPYVDYTPNRCHYSFRGFADYSGGSLTDGGAHQADIAQWIIGADGSGPTRIEGHGTFPESGPQDVPSTFAVTFTYGRHGDVSLLYTSDRSPRGGQIEIEGTDGWISVSRMRILAEHPEILAADPEPHDYQARLTESYRRHHADWLDCIRSRQTPVCDVEVGHRSASVCHLATIVIRLARPLTWDPSFERFVDDPPADRLLDRPMRAPWHL